jgi:transposase
MKLYIGVDFHPYRQTVAYCDFATGELKVRSLKHNDKEQLRSFYRQFEAPAVIGVEATGGLEWFETMLAEMGHELLVGNPRLIRRMALTRQKTDGRDAETILDLLLNEKFPTVMRRDRKSREVLDLLHYRHFLVRKRTAVANQMQSASRRCGLPKFRTRSKVAKELMEKAFETAAEKYLLRSRLLLFDALTGEIEAVDKTLQMEVENDRRAGLLLTHSGIGPLTALAIVHTLGDVRRFPGKEQVTAFVGLDPLEKSSGEKRRIGSVSKHGSKLLRFLLVQAAQTTRDQRLKMFYASVSRRRGKPKAKVAAARKLLVHCFIMLRDEINYAEFCRRGEVGLCGKPEKFGALLTESLSLDCTTNHLEFESK